MSVCSNFNAHVWTPKKCRTCFHMIDEHLNVGPPLPPKPTAQPRFVQINSDQTMSVKHSSDSSSTTKNKNTTNVLPNPSLNSDRVDKISPISTDSPSISQLAKQYDHTSSSTENVQEDLFATDKEIYIQKEKLPCPISLVHLDQNVMNNQHIERSSIVSTVINPSFSKKPCIYGDKCYRRNAEHLARYSHPSEISNINASATNMREAESSSKIPCKYGDKCYRNNPEHLKEYFHPQKITMKFALQDQEAEIGALKQRAEQELELKQAEIEAMRQQLEKAQIESGQRKSDGESQQLEMVKKQFDESMLGLQKEKQDLDETIGTLQEEKRRIGIYLQQLEKALAREANVRERLEEENKTVLKIKLDPPSYWGTNAFDEAYHEVEISSKSPEFSLLQDLLNNTIELHDSKRGTIYGKDPTEFLVTKIIRIHNRNLWHEYCFKKVIIIQVFNASLSPRFRRLSLRRMATN